MYEIDTEGLHQLLLEARSGVEYAWEHYDELAAREHTYTLYGPHTARLGASIPSSFTPVKARKLLKTTRRKNYLIYELDSSYNVLRTIHMLDYTKFDCTFHHFELNGVTYAYPFRKNEKKMYNDAICVLKFAEGNPVYYACAYSSFLFAQFYEYPAPEKMLVSTYRYWTNATHTQYGYPVDRNAPIGALNSPVQRHCQEEVPAYIEFSHWFE